MPAKDDPTDDAPTVPGAFGVDEDPYTDEDGRGDDVDQPLPDIDPADFPEERGDD